MRYATQKATKLLNAMGGLNYNIIGVALGTTMITCSVSAPFATENEDLCASLRMAGAVLIAGGGTRCFWT